MNTLVHLLGQAQHAGLTIRRGPDGTLNIRGPRTHELLVRALLTRKTEVLTTVDLYAGHVEHLDWRRATVTEHPGRCVLCNRPTLLRDPYDNAPMHKTCAETHIRHRKAPR